MLYKPQRENKEEKKREFCLLRPSLLSCVSLLYCYLSLLPFRSCLSSVFSFYSTKLPWYSPSYLPGIGLEKRTDVALVLRFLGGVLMTDGFDMEKNETRLVDGSDLRDDLASLYISQEESHDSHCLSPIFSHLFHIVALILSLFSLFCGLPISWKTLLFRCTRMATTATTWMLKQRSTNKPKSWKVFWKSKSLNFVIRFPSLLLGQMISYIIYLFIG